MLCLRIVRTVSRKLPHKREHVLHDVGPIIDIFVPVYPTTLSFRPAITEKVEDKAAAAAAAAGGGGGGGGGGGVPNDQHIELAPVFSDSRERSPGFLIELERTHTRSRP
jgi:hypothetical protein